jgi:hypothetical protein
MWLLLFLALPLLGIAYVSWHVWMLVPLSAVWRWALIMLIAVSFLLLFGNFGRMTDQLPLWLARLVYDIGNSSLFVLLYLTIVFLILDAGRLFHLIPRSLLFQNFYTTAAILVALFAVFLYGNIHYYNKTRARIDLTTGKPLAHPVKLVLLSDLHLGYHNPRKELARWVDMINGEHADLVLIAGDIIDMSMRPVIEEDMAAEMRRIEAPVYACLGNHDYYSGKAEALRFFKESNIHVLQDSCIVTGDLTIIGRDDRTNRHRRSMEELTAAADLSKYTILLDHQPYHLEEAERAGIDFQFSGHTHYGQLWPISWITDHVYECAFGAHRRGSTRYYVSSGMGIWGGKFRIGTRSEYVIAEISR